MITFYFLRMQWILCCPMDGPFQSGNIPLFAPQWMTNKDLAYLSAVHWFPTLNLGDWLWNGLGFLEVYTTMSRAVRKMKVFNDAVKVKRGDGHEKNRRWLERAKAALISVVSYDYLTWNAISRTGTCKGCQWTVMGGLTKLRWSQCWFDESIYKILGMICINNRPTWKKSTTKLKKLRTWFWSV